MSIYDEDENLVTRLCEALDAVIKPFEQQSAQQAAKAAQKVLKAFCREQGGDPNWEVGLHQPGHFSAGSGWGASCGWGASWECGPECWAVAAAGFISCSGTRLVETQYGFDLMFYDEE